MKRLLFTLAVFLFAETARGQSYTRPSNGASVAVFSAVPLTIATDSTSQVYGMTAFDGLLVSATRTTPGGSCSYLPQVKVLGSLTATGIFTQINDDLSNQQIPNTGLIYMVNVVAPYIEIELLSYSGGGAAACTATVTITPYSFPTKIAVIGDLPVGSAPSVTYPVIIGGVSNTTGTNTAVGTSTVSGLSSAMLVSNVTNPLLPVTTPVTVSSTAALVYTTTSSSVAAGVILQNEGTIPVVCAYGTNSASVTTSRYSFALKASTATADGTGGSATLHDLPASTTIYCTRNGGSDSAVAVTPF